MLLRPRVLAASLSLMAATGGLLVAGTAQAHAQTVASGTLEFSGDAGDYISQGDSYSYSTSNGDALSVSGGPGLVSVSVTGYNGDWWTLDIAAPAGSVLAPGSTYNDANRYPFNGTGPGLSLSGNGRGCNTLTGSFTVTEAVFGSDGYVQTFDATFVQHCEGGTPAASGSVHISNPPAPAVAPSNPAAGTDPPAAASPSANGTAAGSGNSAGGSKAATGSNGAASRKGAGSRNAVSNAGATTTAAQGRAVSVPGLIALGLLTWIVLGGGALAVGLAVPLRRR